jgi:hypothetical protein
MDAITELDQINAAISHIMAGGKSYTINSGGGSRTVTYADYNALLRRKEALETRSAASCRGLGGRIGAGW